MDVSTLPEPVRGQWEHFVDGLNALVHETFGDEVVAVVVGAQWGGMGAPEPANAGLPDCLVTSNLDVHQTVAALHDMMDFADAEHEEAHGVVREPMDPDNVPEHVRQAAIEYAESLGLSAENIKYVAMDNVSDLSKLDDPLFSIEAEQESKGE